jgi:hypothetical protein
MRKHRLFWVAAALSSAAIVVILVPGSPLYVPGMLDPDAQPPDHAVPALIRELDSSNPDQRREAARALGIIGAPARAAVPQLARAMLEDADRGVQAEASLALSRMNPASEDALSALTRALEHKDPLIRMNAAYALARLGAPARAAIPTLVKAINDRSNETNLRFFFWTVQESMIMALGKVSAGSAEAVPALTTILADGTASMRQAAIRALGDVGSAARPALTQLRLLLMDSDSFLRDLVADELPKIEGAAAAGNDVTQATRERTEPQLPEAERQYLWEIEHHGNLLVKYGFGPLAQVLAAGDAAALARCLPGNFTGSDLHEPARVRVWNDYAHVERAENAGHPPVPLNREQFVARLLEWRSLFRGSAPKVKLALMSLHPKQRGQLDGLWEGTTQLRMFGEHAHGAPAEVIALLHYELSRPSQKSLAELGWLSSAAVLQVQTARAPHYLFQEVAAERGLHPEQLYDLWHSPELNTNPGGIYVCDFDRDGVLDILVTDLSGNYLYRGRGDGGFENVTQRYGLPHRPLANNVAAWIDIDGDGWEDLVLGSRIFRNEEGRGFTDYSERCNLRVPDRATSLVVADYDRDGKLDVYITQNGTATGDSWLRGRTDSSSGNYLYHNLGNWQFEEVAKASGCLGGRRSSFTAAWLDANNDGWPDLHVVNEFGDGVLLINKGNGTFTEHALADRPADFGSMGVAVGDINNDGNIDIYCANMYSKAGTRVLGNLAPDAYPPAMLAKMRRFVAGSQLHLNHGGLKFDQVGPAWQVAAVGWAYGPCLADLDNDGWLDIYATCGFVSRSRDDPDG